MTSSQKTDYNVDVYLLSGHVVNGLYCIIAVAVFSDKTQERKNKVSRVRSILVVGGNRYRI